jgi:uncharacterized repeat protein (TIGR01451 family)
MDGQARRGQKRRPRHTNFYALEFTLFLADLQKLSFNRINYQFAGELQTICELRLFHKILLSLQCLCRPRYIFCLLPHAIRIRSGEKVAFPFLFSPFDHGRFAGLSRRENRMKTVSRFNLKLFVLSLLLIAGLQTAPVLAQSAAPAAPKPDVESILTSKKVVVGTDKKETLVEAKDVKPGEIIEYQATYTNKGQTRVSNLTANLPIPEGTDFLRASAKPALGAKASLGDGKFDAIPLKRKVKTPDGKELEQEVPLALYRVLQWNLGELAAGKSTTVSARVRISDAPTQAPAAPAKPAAAVPSTTGGAK